MKKVLVLIVLIFVLAGGIVAKYHPGIEWREIADEKFIVIFPKGYESEAFYTIDIARDIYNKLQKLWGNRVKKRIRIVLNDSYDDANGSATFFPFNWIELYLYTPAPDSASGGCRDWLYMVLSHEMNHVFNMNAGSGLSYSLRKIMGSNPVCFPMIYAPYWLAEGLAVYAESQLSPGGRLDTPDFEIMMREIGAAGKIPASKKIYGEPTAWPGPTSRYLYGSKFVEFLVEKYGEEKVKELVQDFGYYFVPVLMSTRFKLVFDKSLKQLWDEFKQKYTGSTDSHLHGGSFFNVQPMAVNKHTPPLRGTPLKRGILAGISECSQEIPSPGGVAAKQTGWVRARASKANLKILTSDGLIKRYPVFGPRDKLFYVDRNYKEFPGIYEYDLSTGKRKELLKKTGINSLFYSSEDNKIYFSAVQYYKTYYRYSDIYAFDIEKKKLKRLSKGRRLSYPVRAGDTIYCIKRVKTKSFITVLNPKDNKRSAPAADDGVKRYSSQKKSSQENKISAHSNTERIISGGFDSLAQLSICPDRKYIAASLKEKNKKWRVALFDISGELLYVLGSGDVKSYAPSWKSSKEIYFISEDDDHYRLVSYHLDSGESYIYRADSLPDMKYFSFHPENGQVAVSFFDANGFNLGLLAAPFTKSLPPAARGRFLKNRPQNKEERSAFTLIPRLNLREIPPQKLLFSKQEREDEPGAACRAGNDSPRRNEIKSKKYRPLRDLFPKYFTPALRDAGGEIQPGIYLSGNDALEKHAFILQTFYGFESKSPNLNFNYTYDGLYPQLVFDYSQYTDIYQDPGSDYFHHRKKIEFGSLLPLFYSAKRQAYFYTGVYFERIINEFFKPAHENKEDFYGLRAAFLYSSMKKYYDSISYADGLRFTFSYAKEYWAAKRSYRIDTAAFEYQHFISLFRPNVLALRFAVCDSRGQARRVFYMGGAESKDAFSIAGSDLFTLMRGFPKGYFIGFGGYIFNLEYRISLFKIERVFNVVRTIDRVYLTLFSDIGKLWLEEKKMNPTYSFGMELTLVAYIGDGQFDLAGGAALGRNPNHDPVFYVRLGRSF